LGLVAALQSARVALIYRGRLISRVGKDVVGKTVALGEGAGKGGENEEDGSKGAGEHLGIKLLREGVSKGCVDSRTGACSTEDSVSKTGAFYDGSKSEGTWRFPATRPFSAPRR